MANLFFKFANRLGRVIDDAYYPAIYMDSAAETQPANAFVTNLEQLTFGERHTACCDELQFL
jgi:hypothetical protein